MTNTNDVMHLGPLKVVQPDEWPFSILIVDADGKTVDRIDRLAYSTRQKTVAECLAAKHMEGMRESIPEIRELLAAQVAQAELFADSPAAKLALELICSGVAEIIDEPEYRQFVFMPGKPQQRVADCRNREWTKVIDAIGWSRCLQALAAAKGDTK